MVLKLQCASESPGSPARADGVVSCPEFLIQQARPRMCISSAFPGGTGVLVQTQLWKPLLR